jgi:hypothetical protein
MKPMLALRLAAPLAILLFIFSGCEKALDKAPASSSTVATTPHAVKN